ncbi:serine/threonine-protein kinase [Pseudonocardia xinjiangensis]
MSERSQSEETPIRVGNRYRLDERIGAGAMGAVWRGTDELLNRTVAVKELLAAAVAPGPGGDDALEESRQRILREGRIGARLQHPHVISMFDVVVHEDRPWLVMEYLPSKSLAQVLGEKGALGPREVADVGRQVADGLAAAHVAGVVHRDVKPGNVLLAEDGRVKLTDFGVSRAVDDVQLTRTGLIAGTPAFLSPEVARGGEPTAASDVFALGATLYAAVEGTPPFGLDDNAYALLHKVAMGDVRPPKQSGPLTGVIMWLLNTDPAERPSATQARDALAAVAEGRSGGPAVPAAAAALTATRVASTATMEAAPPASAPPAPPSTPAAPMQRPEPGPRRRPSMPVVLAILAVLLVGGGITAAILASRGSGDPTPPPAVPPAASATEAPPTATPEPTAEPTTPRTEPTHTPSRTAEPTTRTEPPPPNQAPPSDPVGFVQTYYSLLPGNTDAAWAMLSPRAQQESNGRATFDGFYATVQSVTVRNARQTGSNTVQADLAFVNKNGSSSNELYRFVLGTDADGRTTIESFSK